MALGDGIRRDIALVSEAERNRFIDAIVKLDTTKFFPDGVSYWDKQEEIHKNAHFHGVDVHFGPAFISWHRVIVNRLEGLLREVDPALSLHYWDWTTDPRSTAGGRAALFTPQFMGNDTGDAGHLLNNFESSEDAELGNGHTKIWREVGAVAANGDGTPAIDSDATILDAGNPASNFQTFGSALKHAHDFVAHSYIGGTISDAHYSFHDPFVFLLHSNLDRLWAKWQTAAGHPDRFASATAYLGLSSTDMTTLATDHVEPWAGGTGLEPWASDATKRAVITYTDISVVTPPCYDTNETNVEVIDVINPGRVIHFNDVPEQETAVRAAAFKIYTCVDTALHVTAGPTAPYQPLSSDPVPVPHPTVQPYAEARFWFEFTPAAGTAGTAVPTGTVTIECAGQSFDFTLVANVIAPPTVAVALALDQSGSMNDNAGFTGAKRFQVLKEAALRFVELIRFNSGVGFIRFDQDAHATNDPTYPGFPITKIVNDSNRFAARTAVSGYSVNPAGSTSVGNGVQLAHNLVSDPAIVAGYDKQAIIVFTDGLENTAQFIADVMGGIHEPTYAIGLGAAEQVDTAALTRLTQGTGGKLLLTDLLSSSIDDYFLTTKYFQQILAGVSNASLVVDPSGFIGPGTTIRIPFILNETDIECTVILNVDLPAVDMVVETPAGDLITPANSGALGVTFAVGTNMSYYRFTLPVALGGGGGARSGTWNAVLTVNDKIFREASRESANNPAALARSQAHGARYSLGVQSYSNLRMNARLDQTSLEPGATMTLRVGLTEYGQPIDHRASVSTELRRPDGTTTTLSLVEVEAGTFETSLVATMAGVYHFRALASGGTMRGLAFTREQTLTGAVFQGGDQPLPTSTTGPRGGGLIDGKNCCTRLTWLLWVVAILLLIIILILLFRR
jgi:hypothetical protein